MAKGYWVASVDVHDMDAYRQYVTANAGPFATYGAKFLVRDGQKEATEGALRSRIVVLEFDSYENALACYHSAEYQAAKALRVNASDADVVVVEGYDGAQPGDS